MGSTSTIDLSQADYSFIGENENDHAGYAVSDLGDVDGDGKDDIIISANGNDDGGSNAGKAYVILGSSLGSSSTINLSQADYSFIGEVDGQNLGVWKTLDYVGDVNGDGKDDIFMGAYANDDGGTNAGKAYLFLGCE